MTSQLALVLAAALSLGGAIGCSSAPREARSPAPASSAGPATLYNDPDATPQTEHATQAEDSVAVLLASQKRITSVMAQALRVGAAIWVTSHDACPKPEDLVAAHLVSEALRTTDAWDHTYRIVCGPRGAVVTSAGPDGKFDTADDIVVGQ